MKKIILFVGMIFVSFFAARAQCTIDTSLVNSGNNYVYPPADSCPCIKQATPYSQTIQGKIISTKDTTIDTYSVVITVDSLRLDSITGLPTGISWSKNPNVLPGGGYGCVSFYGTTCDTVGTYDLTAYGTVWINVYALGGVINLDTTYVGDLNEFSSFGNYYLSVCPGTPVAAFTGNPLIGCTPATITLTDQSTNTPTTWSWTLVGGSPSSSTQSTQSVTYSSPGAYNVKLVVSNCAGSDSLTDTAYVNIYPGDTVTVSTTPASTATSTNGTAIALVTGGTAPFNYNWNNQDSTDTIKGLVYGEYVITVTDFWGCVASDSAYLGYITAIEPISGGMQIKIFPDPAKDVLNLEWSAQSEATVSIIDMNGNVVKTFIVSGTVNNTLDIHDLAAGTYAIRIADNAGGEIQYTRFTKF